MGVVVLEPVPSSGRPDSPYAARPWLAHYPTGVPADVLVPHVALTRLLDDAVSSFPDRTAVTWAGTSLRYRELRDVADHLAAGLAGLGVRTGDRVAVVLPDCPQQVLTLFAVLRLGAVVVPCDPQDPSDELEQRLRDSGARVAVCLDHAVAAVPTDAGVRHVVVTSLVDYLPLRSRLRLRLPPRGDRRDRTALTTRLPAGVGVVPFLRLLKSRRAARQSAVDPDIDVAVLHTTRDDAGILRSASPTHAQLVSTAYLSRAWDTGGRPGEDVVVSALPLHEPRGLAACLDAVLGGATLVLLRRPGVDDVVEALERSRGTVLLAAPPLLEAVARTTAHALPPLRLCVSEGGPLPAGVHRRLEELFAAQVQVRRGAAAQGPSTHRDPAPQHSRPGSLGLPLPSTACKVVDPHRDDREVPVGQPGELLVRGPQMVAGWHGTGAVSDDGYLRTGERVVMDEQGCFVLLGAAARQQRAGDLSWKSTPPSRRSA